MADEKNNEKTEKNTRKKIYFFSFIVLLIVLLGGYYAYTHYWQNISTDNAYVKEDFTIIAPRVSGIVTNVYVKENQKVRKGELLLEIDPSDFNVKVAQAEASVVIAENKIKELRAGIREAEAMVVAREAELNKAYLDFERAKRLFDKEAIPKDQLERAETAYKIMKAQRDAAISEKERIKSIIGDRIKGEEAIIKQQKEILKEAKLALSYTKVFAPQDGYVTKKTVEIGNVVEKGQPLMAIVPMQNPYIEANFKETQLTKIKIGDMAKIKIDLYPNLELNGIVESISTGTGATFSLLPPENATGNWIKVVQRVPVRIKILEIPKDVVLRLGLSCEVTIEKK